MDKRFEHNILFEGIASDVLAEAGLSIEVREVEEGAIIFKEGQPGNHFYLVAEGRISISKRGSDRKQEVLSVVGSNDFFGEMALLDGKNRSATAMAVERTVLGVIEKQGLERYISHCPETALRFARLVSEQLRDANVQFIAKLVQTEKMNLLGSMMTSIVHDFRNPVGTLGMLSHYLIGREDTPELVELGKIASDSLEQIDTMITELLDYSKGVVKLKKEELAIVDLFAKLDDHILKKVEGYGIKVVRNIACDGSVFVDENRFFRLLLNIIRNAWESMKRDGILTISVSREGDQVLLGISDTGCGIPPEILARVFEPFVTHGKTKGTGLGMSIAKSVVEAHDGTIRMESEVGAGTTCYITLPA